MRLRPLHGAVVGALLTAPLIALSYLGWRLLGLPFAPFDVFDWITRSLPGSVVTFGIDAMVRLVRALPFGSTATVAKTAEQAMAIVMVGIGGAAAGAALFAVLRLSGEPGLLFGVILGAVLGGTALTIEQSMNRIPTGSFLDGASVVAMCLAWGLAFGWVYDRLREGGVRPSDAGSAPVGSRDRRRFLIRLAGAAAVATFASTAWGLLIRNARSLASGERWSATARDAERRFARHARARHARRIHAARGSLPRRHHHARPGRSTNDDGGCRWAGWWRSRWS